MTLVEIDKPTAVAFICTHHYSHVMPRHNHLLLGGWVGGVLRAVATWGWGVRPLHTIRKLFPSLGTQDYRELGKLCLHPDEPHNAESMFIADNIKYVPTMLPNIKLLFTWADGIWGKPGYIYQAANWLYGGYIWTDAYMNNKGQRVHPRQLRGARAAAGLTGASRPTAEELFNLGWTHYYGKQFRYIYFTCSRKERKQLLSTSTVSWTTNYPKHKDLAWKISAGKGSRVSGEQPMFAGAVQFRLPAPKGV